jgi:hypothetical protein
MKESTIVKNLFKEANEAGFIKGFLSTKEGVQFQAKDGTMVLLKIIPLDQNKDKEDI